MEKLLNNKVSIITGGASGIGKATAEVFLREGAWVAIFDSNVDLLKQLRGSRKLFKYLVDIRDEESIHGALQEFEAVVGRPVNVLVNNAGINPEETVEEISDEVWDRTLDINLNGSRNMTQIVGGRMRELGINGSIVFVTSVHTEQAFVRNAGYDVSKHGLLAFMRVAAAEWSEFGIRCNAVAPGAIYPTGITSIHDEEVRARVAKQIPLRRWGTPQEIAETIAFLASDRSSYTSGAEFRVDGGLSITSPLNTLF